MRFPVYARGSNPNVDQPFVRKGQQYVRGLVADGTADWVDVSDTRKGVILRRKMPGPRREKLFAGFSDAWSVRASGVRTEAGEICGPLTTQFNA